MHILTIPLKLRHTATSFDKVNWSFWFEGNTAASARVNKLDVEDNTVTRPASASASATWNV